MAIESIAHVLEEIDWEGIIRKIIGQKPEGALDTEQVSLTPAGPVEEAVDGGNANEDATVVASVGDELAPYQNALADVLNDPPKELVVSDVLSYIDRMQGATEALVGEIDRLIAYYQSDPNNAFLDGEDRGVLQYLTDIRASLQEKLDLLASLEKTLQSYNTNLASADLSEVAETIRNVEKIRRELRLYGFHSNYV